MNDFFGKMAAAAGWPGSQASVPAATPAPAGSVAAYSSTPPGAGNDRGFKPDLRGEDKNPLTVNNIRPDISAKLPKQAAAKLTRLMEIRTEARMLYRGFDDEIHGIDRELLAPERDLRNLEHELDITRANTLEREKRLSAADHKRLEQRRAKVDAIKAQKAQILARRERHTERWQVAGTLILAIERYVTGISEPLKAAAEPKVAKTTSLDATLTKIADLQADLHEVRSAPLPASDAKAIVEKFVDELEQEGQPNMSPVFDHGEPPRFPELHRHVEHYGDQPLVLTVPYSPLWPALAWLDRDRLKRRLCEEVELCAVEGAMSADEKKRREAELAEQILNASRVAAAVAWRDNEPCRLPSDLDPRAIIGVTGPAPRREDGLI